MAVINRYGFGGSYGDNAYKGVADDSLTSLKGLAWATTRKCFHLGFNDTQGNGWDEVQDGDWVWPESQACVLTIIDDDGHQNLIVFDEKSGMPYVMNTREGPAGSDMTTVWKDKVDDHVAGSGTAIATQALRPEDYGESLSYDTWHEQSNLITRPVKNSNRGATGFDATGMPTSIEFDSTFYADGAIVSSGTMKDVSVAGEYVHDRKFKGNTLQQKISTNVSNFKAIKVESIYTVSDVQKMPSLGNNTESAYEIEFATPVLWLTRGENLLKNRYDNSELTGVVAEAAGPDGLPNSAMSVTSVALANPSVTGTLMLWSTTVYAITGVSLANYNSVVIDGTTWYLRYLTGSIGASLSLGAGVVFDLRLYPAAISAAAMAHYFDNVSTFAGRAYLPITA